MGTETRRFKDATYEQLARIGKAVSSPRRLELLDVLSQGPRTVEALAGQTGISLANASQHLQILRRARLVDAEKQGLHVEYRLADDQVGRFYHSLRTLAEARLAEIERATRAFLEKRGMAENVDEAELVRRVREGAVTLIDVRPAEEYRAGHLPGAVSVPLPQLHKRISELSRDREVVAYCRGPYCVMAIEAVEVLRGKGFRANRLEQGVLDWRARGWRIET